MRLDEILFFVFTCDLKVLDIFLTLIININIKLNYSISISFKTFIYILFIIQKIEFWILNINLTKYKVKNNLIKFIKKIFVE